MPYRTKQLTPDGRLLGPLDAATQTRLAAADSETLLVWGERVLAAGSLAEVFDGTSGP